MTTCNTTTFPTEAAVADIRVGDRHRKDLGDLVPLIKSIRDLGLLHPLVVTPDMQLVAGCRRLEAVREMGWATVPVHVVDGLDDAVAALRAERDENLCRKDFSPSEAVAIGKALEDLERAEAKKRQQEGGRAGGKASGKLPEASKGEARDKVAASVGMSPRTYDKAKDVAEAAEQDPEKYGDLVQEMDETGKVDSAHKKLKERGGADKDKKGKGKPKRTTAPPSPAPRGRALPGAVSGLKRLVKDGKVSDDDAAEVAAAGLTGAEQKELVKAGPAAVKAKAADVRFLRPVQYWYAHSLPAFDPGAEVSEGARREALEKLNAALEKLERWRDSIVGWIATLEQKLGAGDPEAEQPCAATAPSA
jgi:ParB family chromosome partitioning protein